MSVCAITFRRYIATCSAVLLTAVGSSAALAGHHHHGGGSHAAMSFGPVHGPGSSHYPIVSHPPKIRRPTTTYGNAAPPRLPIIRDHRGKGSSEGYPHPGTRYGRAYWLRRRQEERERHCAQSGTCGPVRDHRGH